MLYVYMLSVRTFYHIYIRKQKKFIAKSAGSQKANHEQLLHVAFSGGSYILVLSCWMGVPLKMSRIMSFQGPWQVSSTAKSRQVLLQRWTEHSRLPAAYLLLKSTVTGSRGTAWGSVYQSRFVSLLGLLQVHCPSPTYLESPLLVLHAMLPGWKKKTTNF